MTRNRATLHASVRYSVVCGHPAHVLMSLRATTSVLDMFQVKSLKGSWSFRDSPKEAIGQFWIRHVRCCCCRFLIFPWLLYSESCSKWISRVLAVCVPVCPVSSAFSDRGTALRQSQCVYVKLHVAAASEHLQPAVSETAGSVRSNSIWLERLQLLSNHLQSYCELHSLIGTEDMAALVLY